MAFAYPLMLDVSDRLVVIIGGGQVAARKAGRLMDAGAKRLRMVAPDFCHSTPPGAELIRELYSQRHLDGAGLAFAATDSPRANEQVVIDARRRGVLVCRADEGAGDFVIPAAFQEGEVTVSVSAGSAALSAAIRDDLQARLDRRYVMLAGAMQSLRPMIRSTCPDAARRAQIYRSLAGPEAMHAAEGGIDGFRRWVASKYPELELNS